LNISKANSNKIRTSQQWEVFSPIAQVYQINWRGLLICVSRAVTTYGDEDEKHLFNIYPINKLKENEEGE